MKRLQAVFHGRVQGVGFRYTAEKLAQRFSVTGYVCNQENGTVELMVEGNEKELRELLKSIRSSHLALFIRNVDEVWSDATNEWTRFGIRA